MKYVEAEIEVVKFYSTDVITDSCDGIVSVYSACDGVSSPEED